MQVALASVGDIPPAAAGVLEFDSTLLAFIFGSLVIALYANKRLGELISPPRGEEYDFIKMLTLPILVGRDLYIKSYLFYVFFLEFLYLFMCVLRPLAVIIADSKTASKFGDTSWPLSAALIVVGVLPATPIIAHVEAALRQLAHSLAQIPDDFFNRVTSLSMHDIENLVSDVPEYAPEVELFWTIKNLLGVLSFPQDEASRMARKFISHKLFHEWTIDGGDIWSQREFERYHDVFDLLRPRSGSLEKDLDDLIRATKNDAIVLAALRAHPAFILRHPQPDRSQLEEVQANVDKAAFGNPLNLDRENEGMMALENLRARWKRSVHDCELAGRRLIALFSIIARNDKAASREFDLAAAHSMFKRHSGAAHTNSSRHNDPVLRELVKLARLNSTPADSWHNNILMSGVVSFCSCLSLLWVYLLLIDITLIDNRTLVQIADSAKESLFLSLNTTLEFCLSFAFAGTTALFIRSSKIRDRTWTSFQNIRNIPTIQYALTFAIATIAAFIPVVVSYALYYISTKNGEFINQKSTDLASTLAYRALFSTIWASSAVSLCILSDVVLASPTRRAILRTCVKSTIFVLMVCFIILMITPGLDVLSRAFWHRLFGVGIIVSVGLFWFSETLLPSTATTETGPQ